MRSTLLTVLVCLLFVLPIMSEVLTRYYTVKDLYEGTVWEDSIKTTYYSVRDTNGASGIQRFPVHHLISKTLHDTMVSKKLAHRAYGDHVVYFTVLNDSSASGAYDTITVTLDIGMFTGHGTVPGTAGGTVDTSGILWKPLYTASGDTSVAVSLRDSTWWTNRPTSDYWFRIRELYQQRNKYYISDFSFTEE